MEPGRAPVSFLVDYDGTISLIDIGDELMARYYPDQETLARKDAEYDAGILGSRELMQWDMDVLPDDPQLLRRAAAEMPQDHTFSAFVGRVRERGAQVEVVSDGFGFYIGSNLAALGVPDVPIATNHNELRGAAGLSFPFGHPACFVCGTCKRERVRLHQAGGRAVVFIGEGTSDRYGAAHADLVFARDSLERICLAQGWPYLPWQRFDDVLDEVERAFADGRLPETAEDLPRWRATHALGPRPFICGPEVWGPDRTTPTIAPDSQSTGRPIIPS
ncbi:MAG TPA: haloacid dehalogenase-like hydrolase [Candidatus Limnocylindrales bacterium]|nr:haloacid dehalogenase-like hydrolase [Candidatus Limnocylindrales bacterium]